MKEKDMTVEVLTTDILALRIEVQKMNDNLVKVNQLLAETNNQIGQLLLVPIANMFPIIDRISSYEPTRQK